MHQPTNNESEIISPTVKSFIPRITSAPDVEEPSLFAGIRKPVHTTIDDRMEEFEKPTTGGFEPIKKRYEKEAWPGRKPKAHNLLSV